MLCYCTWGKSFCTYVLIFIFLCPLISYIYCVLLILSTFLKQFYLFIFREGKGGREEEKHQCVVVSHVPTTRYVACNPGMRPDWESNW